MGRETQAEQQGVGDLVREREWQICVKGEEQKEEA